MTTVTTWHPRLRRTLIALTATAALALTGCGGDDEPEAGASATDSASPSASESTEPERTKKTSVPEPVDEVVVDMTIVDDDVTPVAQSVDLAVGQTLLLGVNSDRAGELHVHSSPEQVLNFEAGDSRIDVTFDKPGSVDIEEHESGALIVRVLVK